MVQMVIGKLTVAEGLGIQPVGNSARSSIAQSATCTAAKRKLLDIGPPNPVSLTISISAARLLVVAGTLSSSRGACPFAQAARTGVEYLSYRGRLKIRRSFARAASTAEIE